MSFLKGILNDLRQRRLWPVPLALIAAIIAVPVVLSKQAPGPAPLPLAHEPVTGTPVAGVAVATSPPDTHPRGSGRDPFTQQKQPRATTATTASSTSAAGAGSSSSSKTSTSASGGGSSSGGTSSSPTGGSSGAPTPAGPAPVAPGTKPTPAPTGLTSTQSYDVALSMTNSSGGLDQIDPVQRLSVLPGRSRPLLVELGVLKGGKRVLFAVQPGTSVRGAGTCTPGPIDCEILSLAEDQTETVGSGGKSVASFAVTGIAAAQHGSAAAADKARRQESSFGRALLKSSPLSALALFHYDPTIGAVVDLRDLTVGGN